MEKMISIGKITRYQGNRGEVRVLPLTDEPRRFELLRDVELDQSGRKTIESIRYHKQYVIIKFEDINDIGAAAELQDKYIRIPEDELLPLAENQYYIYQLLNYRVFTVKGHLLGTLKDIITNTGTDILLVQGNDRDYYIPVADEFIVDIDQEKQRIEIDPIPGLLEL